MEIQEVEQVLKMTRLVLEVVREDNQLRKLNSEVSMLSLKSYISEGFTREEAIQLVVASINSTNK